MKLYTLCKSCQEEIKVEAKAATRPELEMNEGREMSLNCTNCGIIQNKRINDIRAKPNSLIILLGLLIGIVAAIALWNLLGAISGLALAIPLLVWRQEMAASQAFNAYRIRR